ncbi:PIR Superfamily Protein [Plasmodium ovale wallikeri]|uniref:PIR Superfamily Protein n=1 Tax=Plasmodium ovale wallikeri TaxID=864142 RepID=A0A1A9ALV7_PLAOA|nr:PIR Superfamily Protein [Plasmodium ovale wallikeri]SBT59081.1 PIR Superfamily Protein [Plasmodium ovale wallikeri]
MENNDHLKNTVDLIDVISLTCKYDVNYSHKYQHQEAFGKERRKILSLTQQEGSVMSTVGEDCATSLLPESTEKSNLAIKSVITITTILGTSIFLLFLYKFTSLGSLIHRTTRSITDIWKDTQEGRFELFFREREAENINFQNSPINILYNLSALH